MGSRCPTGGRVANDGSLALILTTPTIPGHDGIHGVHALRSHAHFGRIFGRSPSAFANPNESFGWLRLSDTKETTILTSWHQTPSSRDNTLTRSPRWLRAFENFFLLSEACRTRTHRHQEIVVRGGGRERGKEEREVCYLCCFSINLLSDFFPFFRLLSDCPSAEDFFPKPTFFPTQSCWTRFNRYSVPVRPAVVSCSAMMSPRSTRVAISFLKSTASIAIALSNLL